MKDPKETQKEIENCLISELRNMISDIEYGRMGKEEAFDYFKNFMMDAGVNSKITVNVLEDESFGELGKNEARNIKVHEGW